MSTADSLRILPPRRRSEVPDLINQLAQTLRGQQMQKEEQDRFAQSREDEQAKVLAQQFLKLRPEQQAELYPTLAPSVRRFVQDPSTVPAPVLSDLEYRQQEVAKMEATKKQRGLMSMPDDLGAGGRDALYNIVTGGDNPNAPVSGANVAQYTYGNKDQLPPEMVQGQRIADKIDPTGQEAIVHRDVTVPKTRAEIGETNARTRKTNAETGKIGAETKQIGEETEGLIQGRTPGSQSQVAYAERVNANEKAKATNKVTASNPANKGDVTSGMATQARDAIAILKTHPGREGATGRKNWSSAFGMMEEPFDATDEANFVPQFKRLQALLTLPNLDALRGLGHMSDREFATMQASASALERGLSDKAFLAELERIDAVMAKVEKRAQAQAQGLANQGGAATYDPNQESGIKNVMDKFNLTREQAIAALRQRGLL